MIGGRIVAGFICEGGDNVSPVVRQVVGLAYPLRLSNHLAVQVVESASGAANLERREAKRRVLVPTMGALHRGHLELIRIAHDAAGNNGEVVVSIFVNPLQFAPGSDFENYPRPMTEDEDQCRKAK